MMTPEAKLSEAYTRLLRHSPFYGTLAVKVPYVIAKKTLGGFPIKTAATDGVRVYYNPDFLDILTIGEVVTLAAHELSHIACLHSVRMGNRDRDTWGEATDYSINSILVDARDSKGKPLFEFPHGKGLYDPELNGSAEDTYSILWKAKEPIAEPWGKPREDGEDGEGCEDGEGGYHGKPSGDRDTEGDDQDDEDITGNSNDPGNDDDDSEDADTEGNGGSGDDDTEGDDSDSGGNGDDDTEGDDVTFGDDDFFGDILPPCDDDGKPFSQADLDKLEKDTQINVVQAAQVQNATKGAGDGGIQRIVNEALKVKTIDWRDELQEAFSQMFPKSTTWNRPNRRRIASDVYLPSIVKEDAGELAVLIDTSASINEDLLALFEEKLNELVEEAAPQTVHVLYVDYDVKGVDTFTLGEEIKFNPVGGGGTRFYPGFDYLNEECANIKGAIYFTDLIAYDGDFGDAPDYPVYWMSDRNGVNWRKHHGCYGKALKAGQYPVPFGQIILFEEDVSQIAA
jgi:predicted metal-dependent peptidase